MKTKITLVSRAWVSVLIIFCLANVADSSTPANKSTVTKNANTAAKTKVANAPAEKTFTASQLAKFDGKKGRDAYVAYEGFVYDVSSKWVDGEHHGIKAGIDITSKINECFYHENVFFKSAFIKYKFPKVGVFVK